MLLTDGQKSKGRLRRPRADCIEMLALRCGICESPDVVAAWKGFKSVVLICRCCQSLPDLAGVLSQSEAEEDA
jgi:hypothetical protein